MTTPPANDRRRVLPSVDHLLQQPATLDLIAANGRPLVLQAIRDTLQAARAQLGDPTVESPTAEDLLAEVASRVALQTAPTLEPVINATGVIIHTNLGRAPLSAATQAAMQTAAADYNTLEYDIARGRRGSRTVHAEQLLVQLTGAEAALVVNNNAAAVMLILAGLAKRRGVAISRGQLVEIGGGFRIPDVLRESGAKLVEVGTTNRTHLHDYERAISESNVKLVMRAHASNYRIIGFTTEPSIAEITGLAHQHGVPVVDDLGSGALIDPAAYGLGHEPLVQDSLAAGVDVVSFSGDKLLGGPQAGIIVGKRAHVAKLKKHPLTRAIRPDKVCLAGLSATLLHYLKDEALEQVPVWRMISMPLERLRERAEDVAARLSAHDGLQAEVVEGRSTVGGGSLPEETLPTWLVALRYGKRRPNWLEGRLRGGRVIARIEDERVVLDLRTVLGGDGVLVGRVLAVLSG